MLHLYTDSNLQITFWIPGKASDEEDSEKE